MVEGVVKYFAVQEPEEDPRPLLYYWACIQTPAKFVLDVKNFFIDFI